MKRKIVANIFLSIGVVLALAAVVPVKTLIGQGQSAQASKVLTKTVSVGTKDITLRFPENWSLGQPTLNSWVILNVPAGQETTKPTVRVAIGYLERTDHADAVSQLAEYVKESSEPSTFLAIGGWPAFQRVQLVKRSQPGDGAPFPDRNMVQITTSVAADNLLVRLEGDLPSNADQQLKDLVLAIGQSLMFQSVGNPAQVQQELNKLQSLPRRRDSPQARVAPREGATKPYSNAKAASASAPIFPPVQLSNLGTTGELEIAVSNNGTNIVVVKQSVFVTSNDGGQSFPFSGVLPVGDGDSSVAFGQSGNFYHAALFGGACPPNSNCVEIAASTNNGQTFGALVNAAVCANSGGGACSLDQEHIASDRINAGVGGADRVYAGVRNCQGSCGASGAFVTCSPDSGATWAPLLSLEMGSDFPRVTVGGDGFFYVVYKLGNPPNTIRIDKFNPCTTSGAQMTRAPGGFPKTVTGFTTFAGCEVMNGFGGLDRCNDGNILSSPTVTVDDTNANHVYVAWANNTAANNENTLVTDSIDGGVNWRTAVTINTNVTARRFMPWACASGGSAFVTWYDRRAATAANNDLTDYFTASAGLSGGILVPNNDEFKISTTSDPQCNLWPTGPRSTWDSENCSVQPQLAGNCSVTRNIRCDFSSPACPGTETCQTDGFGTNPKYGDYDGNACILGRLYTVFASGVGRSSVGDFFQSYVVTSTPTTLTYTGATSGDYHDAVTLSALLTLSGTSAGVSAQTITFTIGAQSCTGITDATGAASCDLTLNQVPGPYTVTANFTGAGLFQPSSASTAFTITREETTLTYTGDTVIANNTTAHLSGVLLEDGTVPIAGRNVLFTLGTGATAQTCSGVTDAAGVAACTIFPVNQPFGAGVVAADFAGDAFYLPSSASEATIIFAFLDHGSFVVGDETDTGSVEFWGHSWARDNVLSGGPAPDSFKGFASNISTNPPACSDSWTSRPGNSSRPPDTIPPYMGVVVSSSISQSGSTISGDAPEIVVVRANPGYRRDPGHPGTGTVVAVYCPQASQRTLRPRPTPHPRPTP